MSTKEFNVGVNLRASTAQYTAEFTQAGQTYRSYTTLVQSGSATVTGALNSTATAAQAMGSGLRAAGQQGAEGLKAATTAAQANQAAGATLLAALRDQVATTGKSTDELLRYRAAQAGVAAEAAPLILQLQNQRAAQAAAAEAARTEEAAQRSATAAKQQAAAVRDSFLAGLREQAALQGKTSVEVMRYRAAQLGVSEGAEQYIRTIETASKAHAGGAISAAQHAAAMRMLPAQMTDVVTSFASGMPVWMIAIQQGGQIKDSFGGAGNAMRAMAGAITPAVVGLGLLAGAAGLGVTAYAQGAKEADGYRHAIVMTGNAAGTSVGQMTDMARAIGQVIGTQGAASGALAQMAGSGAVAATNLQHFTEVAMGLEKYAGMPIKNTVQDLAELAKAPLQASVKLNEQYHYLSASVYEHIKALDEQGRKEEAVAAAQRAYMGAFEARKNELVANLGTIERAWHGVTGAAGRAWNAILNIGREDTAQQKIDAIGTRIAALRKMQEGGGFADTGGGAALGRGGAGAQARERELQALLAQQAALQETVRLEKRGAEAAADRARESEAKAAWDKEGEQFKTRAAKRDDEIRKAEIEGRALIAQKLLSEEGLRRRIADIREKYKDPKTGGGITVSDNELAALQGQLQAAKQYREQLVTLGAGASELNAGERESLKIGEQLARVTDAKTAARLREKQAIADALGVQLRSNDGLEKSLKAHQAMLDALGKDAEGLNQRAKEQEAANAVFGKGRTAIEQMTLAELQRQMAEAQGSDSFDPKYIAGLETKIAAQKRWVAALAQADYKAVNQHTDELLRGARELATAYADERALSGLTALEREKIVARRAVELKYAKELAAIDANSLTDAEKQVQREKVLQAQRIESAAAEAKAVESYMARASESINSSLTDALMRGFESGKGMAQNLADTVENMFNTMILRPTISAVMTPISLAVNDVMQQVLGSIGLGAGGGAASAAQSLVSGGFSLAGMGGKGLMSAADLAYKYGLDTVGNMVDSFRYGMMDTASWSGFQSAFQAGGMRMAGAVAGSVLNGFSGYGISRALSGGYSAGGWVNTAAGIASMIPGVGPLIAGVVGGLINRAFGRKLKDSGIEGNFGGETGFEGNSYRYYKGGWFRSDKTERSPLDEALRKGLADQFNAMRLGTAAMAQTLGLGTDAIDGFTASIKVSFQGLSEEDVQKKLQEEFDNVAESLATATLGTTEYTRTGETAVQTLTRLSGSLAAVNGVFENLGTTLYSASLAGADMASSLVDLFGGLDGFNAATGAYFQNFYSGAEQREAMRRHLQQQLESVGLVLPDIDASNAREQFRALADAQDRSTDSGRKAWAMLMQLSGAFASITTSGDEAARAAAQAEKERVEAERRAAEESARAA
ncbi:MAG: tail length tape measure protein, partial [Burkholderiaceae bacterium]